MKARDICGANYAKYMCSTTASSMRLTQSDIALQVENEQPDYLSVLGRTYKDLLGTQISTDPCPGAGADAFSGDDVTFSTPTNFTFKRKASSELGTTAGLDVKNALSTGGGSEGQARQPPGSLRCHLQQ